MGASKAHKFWKTMSNIASKRITNQKTAGFELSYRAYKLDIFYLLNISSGSNRSFFFHARHITDSNILAAILW